MPVKKFRSLQEMKASASSETEPLPREVRVVARGHLAVAVPSKASEPLTTETVLDTQEDLRGGMESEPDISSVKTENQQCLTDELNEIDLHCSQLPVQDSRTPDEILGYGLRGDLPAAHREE